MPATVAPHADNQNRTLTRGRIAALRRHDVTTPPGPLLKRVFVRGRGDAPAVGCGILER
jgi:hypothetical protein